MTETKIQKKSDKDLNTDLKEKRESLREFRFGMTGSRTRNIKEGKQLKKDIARILTEQNQRIK